MELGKNIRIPSDSERWACPAILVTGIGTSSGEKERLQFNSLHPQLFARKKFYFYSIFIFIE